MTRATQYQPAERGSDSSGPVSIARLLEAGSGPTSRHSNPPRAVGHDPTTGRAGSFPPARSSGTWLRSRTDTSFPPPAQLRPPPLLVPPALAGARVGNSDVAHDWFEDDVQTSVLRPQSSRPQPQASQPQRSQPRALAAQPLARTSAAPARSAPARQPAAKPLLHLEEENIARLPNRRARLRWLQLGLACVCLVSGLLIGAWSRHAETSSSALVEREPGEPSEANEASEPSELPETVTPFAVTAATAATTRVERSGPAHLAAVQPSPITPRASSPAKRTLPASVARSTYARHGIHQSPPQRPERARDAAQDALPPAPIAAAASTTAEPGELSDADADADPEQDPADLPEADTADAPEPVIVRARKLSGPKAQYPELASQRALEGTVMVRFSIDEEGRVRDPSIESSQPAGVFDQAVLEALTASRYQPRTEDGKATVTPTVRKRYRFHL